MLNPRQIGLLTSFAAASVAAVMVSASYPVAIWGAGVALTRMWKKPALPPWTCPLLEASAAKETGRG
ncbi:1-acyl-sn-glycerol-3-phosphate acyltransferase [Alicyclobacillus tengchongensis]|uniref:Uncharacterized protein n=2 Tax=Alicyclobacillus tolerans TaxID=90970 RepID=A0A1M6YHD5_9BACL|nr:1-acyl-sn-glycerol-3-phosphate acyltransferase [Alicyclobacillus tengchongensis]SHL17701.1 hypothetical protein SAMN05443507_1532 [Alicyclobacillus montanus]